MREQASLSNEKLHNAKFASVQQIVAEQRPFIYLVNKNALSAVSAESRATLPPQKASKGLSHRICGIECTARVHATSSRSLSATASTPDWSDTREVGYRERLFRSPRQSELPTQDRTQLLHRISGRPGVKLFEGGVAERRDLGEGEGRIEEAKLDFNIALEELRRIGRTRPLVYRISRAASRANVRDSEA